MILTARNIEEKINAILFNNPPLENQSKELTAFCMSIIAQMQDTIDCAKKDAEVDIAMQHEKHRSELDAALSMIDILKTQNDKLISSVVNLTEALSVKRTDI